MEPVASKTHPTFFDHSLFVSPTDALESQSIGKLNFELGTDDFTDAMYISALNDVVYTNEACNKRISNAG